MIPKTKISEAVHSLYPELSVGCQMMIDGSYKNIALKRRPEIKAIGGTVQVDEDEDNVEVTYNWNKTPKFDKDLLENFIKGLTSIIPPDAINSVYLTFSEKLDPSESMKNSFETHRQRNGQNQDYPITFSGVNITDSSNGEPVRQLERNLPNDLHIDYRYARNENKTTKRYDLIGQCYWDKDLNRDKTPISDVQIDQMIRAISLLRNHARESQGVNIPKHMLS